MSFRGIPIKVATFDPETGEPTGNFETAGFATLRRCPALGGLLKLVVAAGAAEDRAGRLAVLAHRALFAAETPEAVESAAAVYGKAAEESELATQALGGAVHDFVVAGFVGAGYSPDEAERYASQVGTERMQELKGACLVGSGRLDFTKAPAAA